MKPGSGLAWTIYRDTRKPKVDALNATEVLLLRKQLADDIQEQAQFPAQAPSGIRIAIVEAVVEETIVEGKRLVEKPGSE